MADVFISYASEDRERARKLASVLATHGWSVWWDRKIIAGHTFDQVIERELETARSVVVLWSKDSVASEWVRNESAVAAEKGVLVPALIDQVKLPLEFRRKQTVDLIDWDGDPAHTGLVSLFEGISSAISGMEPLQTYTEPAVHGHRKRRWALALAGPMAVAIGLMVYWVEWQGPPDSERQNQSSKDQRTAVERLVQGKPEAIRRIETKLSQIDRALDSSPDDANNHSMMGYALKDMYQASKGLLPTDKRREYLARARQSFEQALRLDPNNAGAHNGVGNILFFEGKFDEAIAEHDIALRLTGGKYESARHDRVLVEKVRNGEIQFDF